MNPKSIVCSLSSIVAEEETGKNRDGNFRLNRYICLTLSISIIHGLSRALGEGKRKTVTASYFAKAM